MSTYCQLEFLQPYQIDTNLGVKVENQRIIQKYLFNLIKNVTESLV
jgi:hypothetical protein